MKWAEWIKKYYNSISRQAEIQTNVKEMSVWLDWKLGGAGSAEN